ncbi:hypothetical protein [Marinimicrobium sp. ABcell2]|uniref:hypothetical protein n=1 Tax=Marinimicrobium sp. ABcell2 TaxID=3069751 RepID=UPI0027B3E74A|nr:hypothetical protein [Marinimicrobium sp. ABcell2]MDQ2078428.1 hypothetical protein [Marinimicrobium sp. ABcell2]
MKLRTVCCAALGTLLSAAVWADAEPQVRLNQNLGFNVEGYNYTQAEYPCNVDKVLVEKIVERGRSNGLRIEAVGTADKILNSKIPVLAIDIEAMVLGSDEFTFGTRSSSNLPSVRVTAALFDDNLPDGMVTARHSCAIATLNQLSPRSSVLDLDAGGHTVCSATHKCLNDLSRDIVRWVKPQVQ